MRRGKCRRYCSRAVVDFPEPDAPAMRIFLESRSGGTARSLGLLGEADREGIGEGGAHGAPGSAGVGIGAAMAFAWRSCIVRTARGQM